MFSEKKKVEILADGEDKDFKQKYTAEENYRAYKLFSMMDVDNGGSISLRELNRVLMGDAIRFLTCDFEHPDTGIIWGLDEENCAVISSIEQHSHAIKYPFLVKKMKLYKIDDVLVPQNTPSSLEFIYQELLRHHDQPVKLVFCEPIIIINQFSCMLDIEVEGKCLSIALPVGAVYNLDTFTANISRFLTQAHPLLKYIEVNFIKRKRQIFFKCNKFNFRFLFATGPYYRSSCRYALGFSAEDTELGHYHQGQPMLIDLNLNLSQENLEILMVELFAKFDTDGSGEFEFEEFRDFYIKYLDSDESMKRLHDYAQHRFRDLEIEKWLNYQNQLRINKALRRKRLKLKYHDLIEAQKLKFKTHSIVDNYGIRRRLYFHRTTGATLNTSLEAIKKMSARDDIVNEIEQRSSLVNKNEVSMVTTLEESNHDVSLLEKARAQRKLTKLKQEKQKLKRQAMLKAIFEANANLNRQDKADAKQFASKNQAMHMMEVHHLIKSLLVKEMKTQKTNADEVMNVDIDVTGVVASPALKLNSAIFGNKVNVDDIDLENLDSTLMHPAALRYFFIRESKRTKVIFNAQVRHPAFFTSEYERMPSRHSRVALSCARTILETRMDGIRYREVMGVKRCKKTPPEDILPSILAAQAKRTVKFYPVEPRVKYKLPVIGRVTILSIRLRELVQIKVLEANSPFVSISCGDFKFSTEIHSLAGSVAEWDEINQVFRMHATQSLVLEARTGSVMRNILIGSHTLKNEDFLKLPLGHLGECVCTVPLMDGNTQYGIIDVNCIVEPGEEWDWYVIKYKRDEEVKHIKQSTIKKFSQTKAFDPDDGKTSFPLPIHISMVSLYDLKAVHTVMRNRPYVILSCGSVNETAEAANAQGDTSSGSTWDKLDWNVDLVSDQANLIFMVYSGSTTIGRFAISGAELAALQRTKNGEVEILGELTRSGEYTGKITVHCQLDLDNTGMMLIDDSPEAPPLVVLPAYLRVNGAELLDNSGNSLPNPALKKATSLTHYQLQVICGHYTNQSKNFNYDKGSSRSQQGIVWRGLKWDFPITDKMFIKFTLFQDVGSGIPGTHGTRHEYGQVFFKCIEFTSYHANPNPDGKTADLVLLLDVHNNITLLHRLRVSVTLSLQGDELHVFDLMDKLAKSKTEEPLITGYGAMSSMINVKKSIHSGGSIETSMNKSIVTSPTKPVKSPTPAFNNNYSLDGGDSSFMEFTESRTIDGNGSVIKAQKPSPATSPLKKLGKTPFSPVAKPFGDSSLAEDSVTLPDPVFPFRLCITDVVAADLKSVHLLRGNSPHVNIAVANTATSTPAIPNGGSSAKWNGLSFVYYVHAIHTIRIAAWSKSTCIGQIMVTPQELLACVIDSLGAREFFCNIYSEDGKSITGKIKLNFVIEYFESYSNPIAEIDSLIMPEGIQPPILVTLYTITVLNLRPVHPFSRNSPVVRAACEKWKASTSPDNEHVGDSAKWENMMWSMIFSSFDSKVKLTVMSGSIVIGSITLALSQLIDQAADGKGLCEIECYISTNVDNKLSAILAKAKDDTTADKKDTYSSAVGMMRLTYAFEAHTDIMINSDSDSDIEEAVAANQTVISNNPNKNGYEAILTNTRVKSMYFQIVSLNVQNLKRMRSITANSPFVTIKCNEFRAATTTQYLSGTAASWTNLSITTVIDTDHPMTVSVYTAKDLIGAYTYSVLDLMNAPRDNFNCLLLTTPILNEGEKTGLLTIKIKVLDKTKLYQTIGPADEKFEESKKIVNYFKNKVTLPFTLRIVSILGLDILINALEEYINKTSIVLSVNYDVWNKQTAATQQDVVHSTVTAEWVDSDWLFVITDDVRLFEFALVFNNAIQGRMQMTIGDLIKLPIQSNHVELTGYLFSDPKPLNGARSQKSNTDGAPISIGKLKVLMSVAPYVTPEKLKMNLSAAANANGAEKAPILIGKMRVKFIRLMDMMQIYGLFRNSPKVTISLYHVDHAGEAVLDAGAAAVLDAGTIVKRRSTFWSGSTPVAVDAGNECEWNSLQFGVIDIYNSHMMKIRVTSGNELIGELYMTSEELMAKLGDDTESSPVIEGDLMDGVVNKGWFEMGVLRVFDEDCHPMDESIAAATMTKSVATPRTSVLSMSTPTPYHTDISILGISVYELKPNLGQSVFQISPQVKLACGAWKVETNIAPFAGDRANWIIKRSDIWQFTMANMTFLRLHVFSGSALLGSVFVSTRELVEVQRDLQGVSHLSRAIEKEMEPSGKIKLSYICKAHTSMLNKSILSERQSDMSVGNKTHNFVATHSLESISVKSGSHASVIKSVMKNETKSHTHVLAHIPDKTDSSLVLNNSPNLTLPITVTVVEVTCLDIMSLHMVYSNALQVSVELLNDSKKAKSARAKALTNAFMDPETEKDKIRRNRKVTNVSKGNGKHAHWESLNYVYNFLDGHQVLVLTVLSYEEVAGSITITVKDLLSMPRTAQGFTEISRNVIRRADNGTTSIAGKIRLCMLLSPFLSEKQIETHTAEVVMKDNVKLSDLKPLATIDFVLVSCMDISLLYNLLYITVALGKWLNVSDASSNQRGTVTFGNLNWNDVILYERSNLVLTLHAANAVIGAMLVSALDILSVPVDVNGFVVIYGELLSGIVPKGKVSIACKLHRDLPTIPSDIPPVIDVPADVKDAVVNQTSDLPQITSGGDVVIPPVKKYYDRTNVLVSAVSAVQLKQVHKVGKNSPCVKLEYKGFKYQSNSIPYAGATSTWRDLLWPVELNQNVKVKVTIMSGSVVIGLVSISIESILEASSDLKPDENQFVVEQEISKNGESSGKITIYFQFPAEKPVDEIEHSPLGENILRNDFSVVGKDSLFDATTIQTRQSESINSDGIHLLQDNADRFRSTDPMLADSNQSLYSGAEGSIIDDQSMTTANSKSGPEAIVSGSESKLRPPMMGSLLEDSVISEESSVVDHPQSHSLPGTSRVSIHSHQSSVSRPKTSSGVMSSKSHSQLQSGDSIHSGGSRSHHSGVGGTSYLSHADMNTASYASASLPHTEEGDRTTATGHQSESYDVSYSRRSSQDSRGYSDDGSTIYTHESDATPLSYSVSGSNMVDSQSRSVHSSSLTPGGSNSMYQSSSGPSESFNPSHSYSSERTSGTYSSATTVTGRSDPASHASSYSQSDLLSNTLYNSTMLASTSIVSGTVSEPTAQQSERKSQTSKSSLQQTSQASASSADFIFVADPKSQSLVQSSLYSDDVPGTHNSHSQRSSRASSARSGYHSNLEGSKRSRRSSRSSRSEYSDYSQSEYTEDDNDENASDFQSDKQSTYSDLSGHYSWDQDGLDEIDYRPPHFLNQEQRDNKAGNFHKTGYAGPKSPEEAKKVAANVESTKAAARALTSLFFDVTDLNWVPCQGLSVQAVANIIAHDFTAYVLTNVVSSFVAQDLGMSFMEGQGGSGIDNIEQQYSPSKLTTEEVVKYTSYLTVRKIVQVAGTNVLRLQLLKHAVDETYQYSTSGKLLAPIEPADAAPFTASGKFQKRAGMIMHDLKERVAMDKMMGNGKAKAITTVDDPNDPPSDPDEIEMVMTEDKTRPPIPLRGRITICDILGLDISFIEKSIFPKRPYLTACKPYGNWAGETPPVWTNLNNLGPKDMVLNWHDLNGKYRWERFLLRMGQCLVFDLHDGGSGLVIAKCKVTYEDLMFKCAKPAKGLQYEGTMYLHFKVANEYGGGSFGAVIRMHIDLSVNIYVRPKKAVEYWDKHRVHHWKNFPLTPISAGIVRQKYKEISEEYDKQMIIHPVFFGFKIRWKGNPEDETRFIHPIFFGFNLSKKPLSVRAAAQASRTKRGIPNPWKYDPNAAALGRCPICADGVAGCPRCFMLPIHHNGVSSTPGEFEYDPVQDEADQRAAEQKAIAEAARAKRKLQNIHISADGSALIMDDDTTVVSESTLESDASKMKSNSLFKEEPNEDEAAGREKLPFHTRLTTYKALQNYRNLGQHLITVYIKVMPAAYIKRVLCDPKDTIFHLYNMFNSHSNLGNSHTPMICLPVLGGIFELHGELRVESDLLRLDNRGRDHLEDYGFKVRAGSIFLLYFANYKPEYVPRLLLTYFERGIHQILPAFKVYDCIEKLPADVHNDEVQKHLQFLLVIEYSIQQRDTAEKYKQMGLDYQRSRHAAIAAEMKQHKEHQKEKEREKHLMALRFESQLKGMSEKEKRKALKQLMKREMNKKRSLLFEKEKEQHTAKQVQEAIAAKKKKQEAAKKASGGGGDDDNESVGSSKASLNDIELDLASRSSGGSDSDEDDDDEDDSEESEDDSSDEDSSEESDEDDDGESDDDEGEKPPKVPALNMTKDQHAPIVESDLVLTDVDGHALPPPAPGGALFYIIDDKAPTESGEPPLSVRSKSFADSEDSYDDTSYTRSEYSEGRSLSRSNYSGTTVTGGGSFYSTDGSSYTSASSDGSYTSRSGSSYSSSYFSGSGSSDYTGSSYSGTSTSDSRSVTDSRYSDGSYSSYGSSYSGSSTRSGSYDSRSSYSTSTYSDSAHSSSEYSNSSLGSDSQGFYSDSQSVTYNRLGNNSTLVEDSSMGSATFLAKTRGIDPSANDSVSSASMGGSLYSKKLKPISAPKLAERSVATIYSNMTPSIVPSLDGISYVHSDDTSVSTDSKSTGGLFTFRSAFDSRSSASSDFRGGETSRSGSSFDTAYSSGGSSFSNSSYISSETQSTQYSRPPIAPPAMASSGRTGGFIAGGSLMEESSVASADYTAQGSTANVSLFSNYTRNSGPSVSGYGYVDQDDASSRAMYLEKMHAIANAASMKQQKEQQPSSQTVSRKKSAESMKKKGPPSRSSSAGASSTSSYDSRDDEMVDSYAYTYDDSEQGSSGFNSSRSSNTSNGSEWSYLSVSDMGSNDNSSYVSSSSNSKFPNFHDNSSDVSFVSGNGSTITGTAERSHTSSARSYNSRSLSLDYSVSNDSLGSSYSAGSTGSAGSSSTFSRGRGGGGSLGQRMYGNGGSVSSSVHSAGSYSVSSSVDSKSVSLPSITKHKRGYSS